MRRAPLFAVVSLSGASVLVLEILGTRVLGPFYGVSLFLWSALISVTLAALAAGYALGGRWALRSPSAPRLSLLLFGAGLWVLAIPWLRGPVVHLALGWGLPSPWAGCLSSSGAISSFSSGCGRGRRRASG